MPHSQARGSPRRAISASHSGIDSAPAMKYRPRKTGCQAAGACNRSCTKKSTSVAGMALAMPLTTKTASKRRKGACCQGCHKSGVSVCSVWVCGGGVTVHCRTSANQAHRPAASAAQSTATVAGQPASEGSTAASSTPTRPRPSRQATQRLWARSPPPWRAAQLWCRTARALHDTWHNASATTIQTHSTTPPERTSCGTMNRAANPSARVIDSSTAALATARWERRYSASPAAPIQGSTRASNRRPSSSTRPSMASGKPNSRAWWCGRCTYTGNATKASGKPSRPYSAACREVCAPSRMRAALMA